MEYLVIILLLVIILILGQFKFTLPRKDNNKKKPDPAQDSVKSSRFCPLCNTALSKGENVKSKIYPTGDKDSLMEMFGCPNCIPPLGKADRICPVCKKILPADGYVIGRYFVRPGKRHLHVLGCTLCRKIK